MPFNYENVKATAQILIKQFGQSATLKREIFTGGNAWDTSSQTSVIVNYTIKIVVNLFSNYEIDGTIIKAGDKRIYLSTEGLAVEPLVSDKIVIGGIEHSIEKIMPLMPADIVVYYEVQARL